MKRRGTDPRTLMMDRLADWCISIGGLAVIAAVLGIFVFISCTILPLFRPAKTSAPRLLGQGPTLASLVDEHQEKAILLAEAGTASFYDLASSIPGPQTPLEGLGTAKPSAASVDNRQRIVLGTQDGRVWAAQAGFRTSFEGNQRIQQPFIEGGKTQVLDPRHAPIQKIGMGGTESLLLAGLTADGRVVLLQDGKHGELEWPPASGRPSSLLVADTAQSILVGTDTGHLLAFENSGEPQGWHLAQDFVVFSGAGLSALGYPVGQQSILCGSSTGSISACFLVETTQDASGATNGRRFQIAHVFQPLDGGVTAFAASPRDKGFCALSDKGMLGLYFLTNERTLFQKKLEGDWQGGQLLMAPKANGILVTDGRGRASLIGLENPHPEINLKALFSKIWYEGYDKPDYVWQSTGGSDDFEPKFSLTPLIYGTLKGTFYALLFAVPLAVLAALYTSQFMSRRLRAVVKPVIEIMAAVPSVVMGFFAALLLAPFMEKHLFSLILGAATLPLSVLATLWIWRSAPRHISRLLAEESEILVLVLGMGLGIALAFLAGPVLERLLFMDLKIWMRAHWNVHYDQRNSLVVGFAMGFAVIPVIFTICEDALSSVPRHLTSASLSCGATPWQTALRVVLPVALSGIFSAIMVGFGRAVGETMIVLMATGNTPVMDLSAFNGFRALSANVAVEISEAPMGGSLYRVLFLASGVLFLMTFAVNTVAEWIRLHLRKKYSQL